MRAQQCGAVTFVQRFGSAMNLNLHFHTIALDGAFLYEPSSSRTPEFVRLPAPTRSDVARVLAGTARRLQRLLEARRHEADEDAFARDEPLLAWLAQASLRTRIATGAEAGERWRRLGDRVEPGSASASENGGRDRAIARHYEMSLHADVAVPAGDRRRLERLCRYAARPPIAHDRLRELPDGRLTLRLKTRWRDGTTHILMERSDLIDRLVPLIPPPRAHQVRYHGILAPAASLRSRVVPNEEVETLAAANPSGEVGSESPGSRSRRLRWAVLLQRVFAIDALRCPRCGNSLRLLAAIENESVARAILEAVGLPARAPPEPPKPCSPEVDLGFNVDPASLDES